MAQNRFLLLIMLVWFVFLFNIERLDLYGQEPFNIDTSAYVVAALIGVALLAYPDLGFRDARLSTAVAVVLDVITRTSMGYDWAIRSIYLTIPEIAIVVGTLFLMRQVSRALLDYEIKVEAFILDSDNSRVLSRTAGEEQINQELYRARRFERPVAIIYCVGSEAINRMLNHLENDADVFEEFIHWRISDSLRHRYQQVKLAKVIDSLIYEGDIITEYNDGLVICLPENNAKGAESFIRQLSTFIRETLQFEPLIGVASFPDDGLVFGDLARIAREKAHIWTETSRVSTQQREPPKGTNESPAAIPPDTAPEVISYGLLVGSEQRLKIEQEAAWVNGLAYQSSSARYIYRMTKRVMDVMFVLLLIPCLLPAIGLVALLVYVDDGRPIFYTQQRTGYGGRRFKIIKFRTMLVNARPIPPEVVQGFDGKTSYVWPKKVENDPRITRSGRILRKTGLDELPQLFNVLRGDMSLVGPRPTTWDLDKYTLHQTERLTVRPGLTGLWQIAARETTDFNERLLWDLKYIEKMSLWLDLQIIWRTFAHVLKRKGA